MTELIIGITLKSKISRIRFFWQFFFFSKVYSHCNAQIVSIQFDEFWQIQVTCILDKTDFRKETRDKENFQWWPNTSGNLGNLSVLSFFNWRQLPRESCILLSKLEKFSRPAMQHIAEGFPSPLSSIESFVSWILGFPIIIIIINIIIVIIIHFGGKHPSVSSQKVWKTSQTWIWIKLICLKIFIFYSYIWLVWIWNSRLNIILH